MKQKSDFVRETGFRPSVAAARNSQRPGNHTTKLLGVQEKKHHFSACSLGIVQRGKSLEPESSVQQSQPETGRTSRQKALAAKKSKAQEKREGKSVASSRQNESDDGSEERPAPPKKAKVSKGKEIAVERDRSKKPTVSELLDHLKNGVSWIPRRFADTNMMVALGIDRDIQKCWHI
ncbi:hypothetical protein Bca52824_035391 [Brassica carinata]|uniref:Uncharacterized protein n=1 Tax=Brassica carinata TaxID=52824 RepID=A0A8X7V1N4_BRACI|nr:hypothetical protein Bca52824_035391 [Brassica carinata]